MVLLIAILPSDGDVKPGGPLGAFREEQAMSRHRFHLPSFHHHTKQHNYTTRTATLTVTLTSTFSSHFTDTHSTRNVVCLSGA